MASTLAHLSSDLPPDPDAQATVTDFLDYTELFPSDLVRSLKLIGKLDESYHQDTAKIHELTKTYGSLPTIPAAERPTPQSLRDGISKTLDHALKCRQSAMAEATRLCAVADNFYNRLLTITTKLKALPKPPSRDPTPVPQARSPKASRGRKPEERTPRITLRVDGHGPGGHSRQNGISGRPKHRSRRIIVPGEILLPFDPASPGTSITSDSESDRASSPARRNDVIRLKPEKSVREKVPKVRTTPLKAPKTPRIRPPGMMGTNVHSAVAGISVSNAMALQTPPPADAKPGSRHAPWFELTEWELNKLRKRMKKNALWLPSDTMIRRELAESGRGRENYKRAKDLADAAGEELLNERPQHAAQTYLKAEESNDMNDLLNRGMKLNEAKKLKKEALMKEQEAQQALDLQEASKRIADAGKMVESLLLSSGSLPLGDSIVVSPPRPADASKFGKKRKRDSAAKANVPIPDGMGTVVVAERSTEPDAKRSKLNASDVIVPVEPVRTITLKNTSKNTIKIPAGAANNRASSPTRNTNTVTEPPEKPLSIRSTRASAAVSQAATPAPEDKKSHAASIEPHTALRTRTPTISLTLNKKAASAEPPSARISLRRASNSSLPSSSQTLTKPVEPAAPGRRAKRPAPGIVTTHDDSGPKISVNARRNKPGRKKSLAGVGAVAGAGKRASSAAAADEADDDIDPSEPRWCICGGPSWGTMVACENQQCAREWFHLDCVGLEEIPKRTQKWWCPECRVDKVVDGLGRSINGVKK